jgi:hypothetical protein
MTRSIVIMIAGASGSKQGSVVFLGHNNLCPAWGGFFFGGGGGSESRFGIHIATSLVLTVFAIDVYRLIVNVQCSRRLYAISNYSYNVPKYCTLTISLWIVFSSCAQSAP